MDRIFLSHALCFILGHPCLFSLQLHVLSLLNILGENRCNTKREKYVPRGGPDGGDGGRGGHVILFADPHVQTLLDFTGRPVHKAEKGRPGSSKNQTGRMGSDLRISVPVGTMVFDEEGHLIIDLAENEQEFVIARGGSGGRGNSGFATSTHQSPREFTPGEEGEEHGTMQSARVFTV